VPERFVHDESTLSWAAPSIRPLWPQGVATGVPLVGLSPDPENAMAIRSYKKVGFRFRRNYSIDDGGSVYSLMTLDLSQG
jgi:hypothetical protein